MTRELSLHHLSVLRASPEELVDAAATAGFDRVGVRLVEPDSADVVAPLADDARRISALAEHARDRGIRLLDVEAFWIRPQTRVRAIEPVLAAAAELGAQYLLTVGMDPDIARLLSALDELCALASPYGITPAVEMITYSSIGTVADLARVVKSLEPAHVVPLVDSLQFFRSGAAAADADALPTAAYAQLSDAPAFAPPTIEARRAEARGARLAPGDGELDLVALLRALPADIPIAVEAPNVSFEGVPIVEVARRLFRATTSVVEAADAARSSHREEQPR